MRKDKKVIVYDISDFFNCLEWIDQLAEPLNENINMITYYKSIVRCLIAEQLDLNDSTITTSLLSYEFFNIKEIIKLKSFFNELLNHPDNKYKTKQLNTLNYFILMMDNEGIGELVYDENNKDIRRIIVKY